MSIFDKYDPVIGIEIHIELNTKTKMFCGCKNSFDTKPNQNTCPVCLGFPGSLPVINKEAFNHAIKLGHALNCKISENSFMARKNYFYPDLSKNYQISQSTNPIIYDGFLNIPLENKIFRVDIERAHLEEDAAKNTHLGGIDGRLQKADYVLVNYNRGGVPLIEIVTYPLLNTGKNVALVAKNYVKTIHDLVISLGISDAKMEEGSLRADINISLRKKTSSAEEQNKVPFGERSEVKNINSFKSIEKAVLFEVERQANNLDNNKKNIQQTRLFQNNKTIFGREKSDADDYRYFPEPDLIKYSPNKNEITELKQSINFLTIDKKQDLQKNWGFSDKEMLDVENLNLLEKINESVKKNIPSKIAKKWWVYISTLENNNISIENIIEVEKLIKEEKITPQNGEKVLYYISQGENEISKIIEKYNLKTIKDNNRIETIIKEKLKEDNDILQKLKNNNMKVLGIVIGKVMKETKGQANPNIIKDLILKNINKV